MCKYGKYVVDKKQHMTKPYVYEYKYLSVR